MLVGMDASAHTISIISAGLIVFVISVIVVGIYQLHSLPGTIAERKEHPQAQAITVCSVLGLLMFPLWMFALVWAYAGVLGSPLPKADEPPSLAASPKTDPDVGAES